MIKIDTDQFDWNSIQQIYGNRDKGVVIDLVKKLKSYIKDTNKENNKNVIQAYKAMFGEEIEFDKVYDLLCGKSKYLNNYITTFENCQDVTDSLLDVITKFYNLSSKTKIKNIEKLLKEKWSDIPTEVNEFISKFYKYKDRNSESKIYRDERMQFIKQYYKGYDEQLEKLEIISKCFGYDKFASAHRHKLISAMNVNVCPYCNRQYISNYEQEESNTKTTADLDHFYPKSLYPYLALSLYNFIPSCQICNSRFKGTKNIKNQLHLYPYEQEFGEEVKFEISSEKIDYLVSKSKEFEIKIKYPDEKKEARKSIEVFKLHKVYQTHKDYVKELIRKVVFYNASQRKEYLDKFEGLFSSEEEILGLLFGQYVVDGDFSKQPLAKLTRDILNELGVSLVK